jgi:UDP-N-acetylglucosamine--N-acetylmuramyl-(pentapeptide) pyrophosphoryl-undecaprenol N-acetylglucosamine transferase
MKRKPYRIVIAASGSGGHLVPALCIAEAIKQQQPECEIEFIGSGRPLEQKLIGAAGFKVATIDVIGFKDKKTWGKIRSLSMLPRAFIQTWRYFSSFRPQLVVGVGGYVSLLPVLVAALRKIPRWVHEAELKPGVANRLQGWYATRVSTAFPRVRFPFRRTTVYTGQPLRKEIVSLGHPKAGRIYPRRILILGGSQGADSLDKISLDLAPFFRNQKLLVWHQCRVANLSRVKENYCLVGVEVRVESFIDDMADAYSWADIIVSRAGANAVMEISVVNKPTIFVPYPAAQGQHQLHNAMLLVRAGKALLVEEGGGFAEVLKREISNLLDPEKYREIQMMSFQAPSANAAEKIAKGCLQLIAKND